MSNQDLKIWEWAGFTFFSRLKCDENNLTFRQLTEQNLKWRCNLWGEKKRKDNTLSNTCAAERTKAEILLDLSKSLHLFPLCFPDIQMLQPCISIFFFPQDLLVIKSNKQQVFKHRLGLKVIRPIAVMTPTESCGGEGWCVCRHLPPILSKSTATCPSGTLPSNHHLS